jgi:hypothetical protein
VGPEIRVLQVSCTSALAKTGQIPEAEKTLEATCSLG